MLSTERVSSSMKTNQQKQRIKAANKKALIRALFLKPLCADYFSDKIHLTSVLASAADTCGLAGIGI